MKWIALGVLALILIWLFWTYVGLVRLRQRIDAAFVDLDVQLKRRHALIPRLVETVQGYVGFERPTLEAVLQAHAAASSALGRNQTAASEGVLQGALGRMIALAASYPDLRDSAAFQDGQRELAEVESSLALARRSFNARVAEHNAAIVAIPAVLLARPLGFEPHAFFDDGRTQRIGLDGPSPIRA